MTRFILASLALSMGSVHAAQVVMEDQSQLNVPPASTAKGFAAPAERELPDNAFGKMVRDGYALFVDTRRLMPNYVGNGLNCSNCHLDQGRLANSAPLWGAYPMYPAYRKKNDKVNTFAERIQGCFQFSMNGKPPAADSPEMTALSVYAYWLASKAPIGVETPGRGYPDVPEPAQGYDFSRGEQVYKDQCAVCHGNNGEGQKVASDYVMPPLWGKDSYNWGAGMQPDQYGHLVHQAQYALGQARQPLGPASLGRGGLHQQTRAPSGSTADRRLHREDPSEVPRQ
ncbi:thiosulfate dehydrogenase [Pseudomonas sp. HLS-6 TE3448]